MVQDALLIFAMTFAGTLGALFFKRASATIEPQHIFSVLWNIPLYVGGCFYLLGAVLNIILLRRFDYSVLYPLTSLTYIWTACVSHFVFGERITKNKALALALIVVGAVLINS